MKKLLLATVLSVFALGAHAKVTTIDNPFQSGVDAKPSSPAIPVKINNNQLKSKGSNQCANLPRTCGQMVSCDQAKLALKCGNTKLDRDKDGVPCESICPGG